MQVLDALRNELRTHIGADEIDLPTPDCDVLLNRSYWELLDKFPFRAKETSVSIPTTASINYITIPADFEAIVKCSVYDSEDGKFHVLDRMTLDVFETLRVDPTVRSDDSAMPERYLRRDDKIFLYPTPDDVYPITVYYWELLADMIASTDESKLPRNWQEIILMGAVYRAYMRIQDYERANAARSHWSTLISSASITEDEEESDSPRAGLRISYGGYDW